MYLGTHKGEMNAKQLYKDEKNPTLGLLSVRVSFYLN